MAASRREEPTMRPRNDEVADPTKTRPGTPVREDPAPFDDPDRYYQPDRLCPDQSKEGTWHSRP